MLPITCSISYNSTKKGNKRKCHNFQRIPTQRGNHLLVITSPIATIVEGVRTSDTVVVATVCAVWDHLFL